MYIYTELGPLDGMTICSDIFVEGGTSMLFCNKAYTELFRYVD